MLDTLKLKFLQGKQYIGDIKNAPMRSEFRGLPLIDGSADELPSEDCCPSGALTVEKIEINPNYKDELKQLLEKAKNSPDERQKLVIGRVSKKLADQALENGFDITGYMHDLDVSGVRHAFLEHGTEKTEIPRGQIPIQNEDLEKIPYIIYFYDTAEFTGKNKTGLETITYKKKMSDNTMFYVEEIRNGKKTLSINTMYKHKNIGSSRTSAGNGSPLSNADTYIMTDFPHDFNPCIKKNISIDLGKCTLCGNCKSKAVSFTNRYKSGSSSREKLIITEHTSLDEYEKTAVQARKEIAGVFSKSLKLRQVSAGGCNGCEMELNACSNPNFDMGRFGIEFTASPRHADGIVITGPLTKNMTYALEDCYKSIPEPKIIILAGACSISGGVFRNSKELDRSFLEKYPIDLYIPGCPVHPLTFINAVLSYIGA